MTTYDVHQHLWPPDVVAVLRARRSAPRLDGDVLELGEGRFPLDVAAHDLDGRLALLDRDGVDVAVVSLQPTLELEEAPELADAYHEGVAELVARADGRLRAFAAGRCLPEFAGACVAAGTLVSGIGDLGAELEHAGQALFVHPGPPRTPPPGAPAWWAPVVDYPAQLQAAYAAWIADGVERHPGLPVVFAALAGGSPVQVERLHSRGVEPGDIQRRSIYFDTASYGRRALELCIGTYGAGQLVYGSDVPVIDPRLTLTGLEELGDEVLTAVRAANPARIFG